LARKKDEEKRKKILESATKVFARMGFSNTRIQDVAFEAGIAHGTVYLYFKSKDELFISIFQESLGELIKYADSEIQKKDNAEDKLRRMLSLQLDVIEENPDLTKLILIEFPRTGNFLNDNNIDVLANYIDLIGNIISDGIKEGIFSTNLKIDIVATMIYAAMQGIATRWILDGMSYSLKTIDAEISEIFLKGLKSK
jgi:TetR/AcrR family transcriptional regulator, fatty acid metabolism regulator protein